MKNNFLKYMLMLIIPCGLLTSCTKDDDTTLPNYSPIVLGEDFETNAVDNTLLTIAGWNNYAEAGTAKWKFQYYSSNNYAEFTSYQSGDATNIAWLISPSINMDAHSGEKLVFQSAQSYVTNVANSLEVLVSTNYDGTNVTAATWTPLNATLPTTSATYFAFIDSGFIDLSSYTGNINIAFRVKGSGTNTSLDGSYQIDNFRIFY